MRSSPPRRSRSGRPRPYRRLRGFELEPAVPAESVFHYRNKLEYSFTTVDDGTVGSVSTAPAAGTRCWTSSAAGSRPISETQSARRSRSGLATRTSAFDQEAQRGYLRHLVVREGRNTGQALVVLVTARGELGEADALVETLRQFPEVRSIHWAVNESPAEVTNVPTTLLWGEEAIEEEILGLRVRIRPNAFLQTNTAMCEVLYGSPGSMPASPARRPCTTSTAGPGRSGSPSPAMP